MTGTVSIDPRMASSAAYCAMDVASKWTGSGTDERLDQRFRSQRVADPPAGHGKRFRDRADDDDVFFEPVALAIEYGLCGS